MRWRQREAGARERPPPQNRARRAHHDDRLHKPEWQDVNYAPEEMTHCLLAEDAQKQLAQLLTGAHADQTSPLISSDQEAKVERRVEVTALAARFADSLTKQPDATPLDALMAVYGDLFGGMPAHSTSLTDRAQYGPEHSVVNDHSPSLLLLRNAKTASGSRSSLVIAHSLLGDHSV